MIKLSPLLSLVIDNDRYFTLFQNKCQSSVEKNYTGSSRFMLKKTRQFQKTYVVIGLALQVLLFLVCFEPLLKTDERLSPQASFCSSAMPVSDSDDRFIQTGNPHEPVILSASERSRHSDLSHGTRLVPYAWFKPVTAWIPCAVPARHIDSLTDTATALHRKSGVYVAKLIPKYPSF